MKDLLVKVTASEKKEEDKVVQSFTNIIRFTADITDDVNFDHQLDLAIARTKP